MKLVPIETDEQWAEAAVINSAFWPQQPASGAQLKEWSAHHPAEMVKRRLLAVDDSGNPRAYARYTQTYWLKNTQEAVLGLESVPGELGVDEWHGLLRQLEEMIVADGLTSVQIHMPTMLGEMFDGIRAAGYEPGTVSPVTALDLDQFDPAPYAEFEQKARERFELLNMAQLFEADEGERRYYEWEMAVMADVPMQGEFEALPFDVWVAMGRDPTIVREGIHLLLDGGRVVASSQLLQNHVDRSLAATGLTGTLPEYRRQGLASALKSICFQWGKSNGVRRVYTDNEENNPMLQLNKSMGFREVFRMCAFSRKLA